MKYPFRDLTYAFDASGIWRSKGIPPLPCVLGLVGVKVYQSGGNRCLAQVVSHGGQLRTPRQSMCGVLMSHPMRTCPVQLLGRFRGLSLDGLCSCYEEAFGDVPQSGGGNAVQAAPCLQIS